MVAQSEETHYVQLSSFASTYPLPPSATFSVLLISRVSTIMTMEGSSMETFRISGNRLLREPSVEMLALDDKTLALDNLKDIKYLKIFKCENLTSISFKGLSQLISLKSLTLGNCGELFSSDDVQEQTHEDVITANEVDLLSLESLRIIECGITGKWLSLMLRHSPTLKELYLYACPQLKQLKIEKSSSTALEILEIGNRECLALEGVQSLGTLRSLQLHSCMALERLEIMYCSSLVALEGLRSLVNLKHLKIRESPALDSLTALESYEPAEGISSHSYELFFALESLKIYNVSPLNTSFCIFLTCLRRLTLNLFRATGLTYEQEGALLLLGSLEDLRFHSCWDLVHFPAGLRVLPSLKTLKIKSCNRILGLPRKCLPPSLEELIIIRCSFELSKQCRWLATSKLAVKIDGSSVAKKKKKIDRSYVD